MIRKLILTAQKILMLYVMTVRHIIPCRIYHVPIPVKLNLIPRMRLTI